MTFCILAALPLLFVTGADVPVKFQAHRGGLGEYPENTMAAFQASWAVGALPEMDLRTTRDNEIICLHDATLARVSDVPEAIRNKNVDELTLEEVRSCNIISKFGPAFAGEKVPLLKDVFARMQGHPDREVYLDFKDVELSRLVALLDQYKVGLQAIFSHDSHDNCRAMHDKLPGLRTMLWIGGAPEEIRAKFAEAAAKRFEGLNQVQLHLHPVKGSNPITYLLPADFLKSALDQTQANGIDLEVLPFAFDDASLAALLDLGIRWYATDTPSRFAKSVEQWKSSK